MKLARLKRSLLVLARLTAAVALLGTLLADRALAYRFVVMGDSRSDIKSADPINTAEVKKIRDTIRKLTPKPDFVIFLADMAYCGAQKASDPNKNLTAWNKLITGTNPTDPTTLPRIVLKAPGAKPAANEIRLYVAVGNHELYKRVYDPKTGKQKAPVCVFFNQTKFKNIYQPFTPTDGQEINSSYETLAYTFEHGTGADKSLFVVLDSFHLTQKTEKTPIVWYERFLPEQLNWLERKLDEHRGEPFIFVMSHTPARPISTGMHNLTQDQLWLILDRYNISTYFGAHEHTYDRKYVGPGAQPYKLAAWNLQNKILHMITGKAGAVAADDGKYTPPEVSADQAHASHFFNFVVVDVAEGKAKVKTYGRPTKSGVSNIYQVIDDKTAPVAPRGVPIPGALKLLLKGRP
jgi:hypothetical protein